MKDASKFLKRAKIAIIIEARMTSSRLPGKVMLPAAGRPLLAHLVERMKGSDYADTVVIATTINKQDDPIVNLAADMSVNVYRGSENDVLKRVLDASRSVGADIIVEVTGDCPLNDPRLVDKTIEKYLRNYPRYNYVQLGGFWGKNRSLPDGFTASVFSTKDLEFVERLAKNPADREHVSLFFYSGGYPFNVSNVLFRGMLCWPELAVTLDTPEDYSLIKMIFESLYPQNPYFSCLDVIKFLRKNSRLLKINKHVERKNVKVKK